MVILPVTTPFGIFMMERSGPLEAAASIFSSSSFGQVHFFFAEDAECMRPQLLQCDVEFLVSYKVAICF